MSRKHLTINQECGKRFKAWLNETGYTQHAIAKDIDYTPQQVNAVANGKKRMTPEFAKAIENWSKDKYFVCATWLLCEELQNNDIEVITKAAYDRGFKDGAAALLTKIEAAYTFTN